MSIKNGAEDGIVQAEKANVRTSGCGHTHQHTQHFKSPTYYNTHCRGSGFLHRAAEF